MRAVSLALALAAAASVITVSRAADVAAPAAAPPAPATRENFQDWAISCEGPADDRYCTLVQELLRREDNRRVVLLEVKPEGRQRATAGLTLPFGLALSAGVGLQVDDAAALPRQNFSTCMPQGCLVPLVFDAGLLAALQRGSALKVTASTAGGAPLALTLSLKGFDAGYARMLALAASATSGATAGGERASPTPR